LLLRVGLRWKTNGTLNRREYVDIASNATDPAKATRRRRNTGCRNDHNHTCNVSLILTSRKEENAGEWSFGGVPECINQENLSWVVKNCPCLINWDLFFSAYNGTNTAPKVPPQCGVICHKRPVAVTFIGLIIVQENGRNE
jgi:hypothetical protein